jgi:acetylornithine deacetylase/succinyl-diaminopimelate desuccinylase-like protein
MNDGLSQGTVERVLARAEENMDAALERLFVLLRIKSISTDPAYAQACRDCAAWHAADLASIGFDAAVRETTGLPMVVAHDRKAAGRSALFYGHYDVQPVDPLELWDRDPFDPSIATLDGRKVITGRGSADDKGQVMTFVEACRAWKEVTGALPIPLSILLEGEAVIEERCGGPAGSYVNRFWLDVTTGAIWRSEQWVGTGTPLTLTAARPAS